MEPTVQLDSTSTSDSTWWTTSPRTTASHANVGVIQVDPRDIPEAKEANLQRAWREWQEKTQFGDVGRKACTSQRNSLGLMVVSFPGDFFFKGIFQENSHHSAIVETKLTKDWVLKPSICHRTNSRSWAWFRLNITIKWIQMVEDTVRRYCDSVIAGTLLQCLAGSSS